jgi:hypothetical protein
MKKTFAGKYRDAWLQIRYEDENQIRFKDGSVFDKKDFLDWSAEQWKAGEEAAE